MRRSESAAELSTWEGFLARLYRQSEFEIKLGLGPIRRALELEGAPHKSHSAILIGGTNGKGETASFLSSILQAHGVCVGLYTSPHILDLRERFRVDGQLLDREAVHEVGRHVLERYGAPDDDRPQLSFFELTTLMAVLAFSRSGVDVGVYEVGLGGRLDATNALDPTLSIVTSVALDHTDYLGDTLESVAGEKAGIFRSDKPAVIGHQSYDRADRALQRLAPERSVSYGRDFGLTEQGAIVVDGVELAWRPEYETPTRMWNAACAVQAARVYLGEEFDVTTAEAGLSASRWPGRLDIRTVEALTAEAGAHTYLFDAAHNPDAANHLFEFIERNNIDVGAIVCSAMGDKDLEGIFAPVPDDIAVFGAVLESERGATTEQLSQALGERLDSSGSTAEALEEAHQCVGASDGEPLILVFGSIYLLGECFDALGVDADSLVTHTQ